MSRHLGYSELSQEAILQDRMLYLLRLSKRAGERQVEKLLGQHGFDDCVFYWDDTYPFFRSSTKHMGYCIVEFPDKATRDRAMAQLQGVEFKSKRILTRLPRLNYVCALPTNDSQHACLTRARETLRMPRPLLPPSCPPHWRLLVKGRATASEPGEHVATV